MVGDNVEQWQTTAAAARGRGSDTSGADDDTDVVDSGKQWRQRRHVKPRGVK